MEKINICTSDGVVTKITDLGYGKVEVKVYDTSTNMNLFKILYAFDNPFQEGESIDIDYNVVGRIVDGKLSGRFDFEFRTKVLVDAPACGLK
jgi:hypothetical protein